MYCKWEMGNNDSIDILMQGASVYFFLKDPAPAKMCAVSLRRGLPRGRR